MGIDIGIENELEITVTQEMTADFFGSGEVYVFATPCLILQMEKAAAISVADKLDEGMTTVGTVVNIEHCAPTPVGMKVWAKAVLKEADGRRLLFEVSARDEKEVIGRGTHERFIVDKKKFVAKANAKGDAAKY